jgi:hypothetical protein
MATLTVAAPGWKRYRGQMSRVPPARSMRVGAVASILMAGTDPASIMTLLTRFSKEVV